jgi:transposase
MEARTVSSLPTATPHHDVVRCLLAIELSKSSWVVAVHTPLSDKISRYMLEGCDWKGLLELIGESVNALLGSLARQWK